MDKRDGATADTSARLKRLYTAAVNDILDELGIDSQCLDLAIKPIERTMRIAGPAFTIAGAADPSTDDEYSHPEVKDFSPGSWHPSEFYTIITLPLSVWMLTSYFRAIPVELEEAAIIDGCSRLGVLFRITLPLSLPGVVAIVVYAFVTTWNEFIFALVFAQDYRVKTLPIGIAEFSTEFDTDWGAVMAASLIMTLPIAVLFLFMQKLFVGGLTAGAVKG